MNPAVRRHLEESARSGAHQVGADLDLAVRRGVRGLWRRVVIAFGVTTSGVVVCAVLAAGLTAFARDPRQSAPTAGPTAAVTTDPVTTLGPEPPGTPTPSPTPVDPTLVVQPDHVEFCGERFVQLRAVLQSADGTTTPVEGDVEWRSADPSIARVSSEGVVLRGPKAADGTEVAITAEHDGDKATAVARCTTAPSSPTPVERISSP
jgi:hypothetical protein